jgi:hypothetical protein
MAGIIQFNISFHQVFPRKECQYEYIQDLKLF